MTWVTCWEGYLQHLTTSNICWRSDSVCASSSSWFSLLSRVWWWEDHCEYLWRFSSAITACFYYSFSVWWVSWFYFIIIIQLVNQCIHQNMQCWTNNHGNEFSEWTKPFQATVFIIVFSNKFYILRLLSAIYLQFSLCKQRRIKDVDNRSVKAWARIWTDTFNKKWCTV